MTKGEAIEQLLNYVRSQIGYHEGSNNYNAYAPIVAQLYGANLQNQPWCDIFVDAAFCKCFGLQKAMELTYQYKGCGGAACRNSAQFYKDNHAYYQVPEVADQVFFYVDGVENHTGIVEFVTADSITTIEGNTSDSVKRKTYSRTNVTIAGYGRPRWEVLEDTPDTGTSEPIEIRRNYFHLEKGDGMKKPIDRVKAWQALLREWGYNIEVDGQFGSITEAATFDWQTTVSKYEGCDITPSGEVGQREWEEIIKIIEV